jgi:hypothetical protein
MFYQKLGLFAFFTRLPLHGLHGLPIDLVSRGVPFASSFFAALRLGGFGGADAIAQYNDWLVVGVLGHNARP